MITGVAGFNGSNLALKLLSKYEGIHIIGLDNMNSYYDVSLKEHRLKSIETLLGSVTGDYSFVEGDIADKALIRAVFEKYCPDIIVNLAAQAGVRYSIENQDAYIESNLLYPVTLYAVTKKANELMAYAYCRLYGIPATGRRFFTVYGPAGRPDMAYFHY